MGLTFTITGRPITKKNSQQIFREGEGRPFIMQSKAYRRFEKEALWQLGGQRRPVKPIENKVDICVSYYMPDRRQPDLIGLLQATSDILEKSGIIINDKNIRHYGIGENHSEIVGIDKENPRTEIWLQEVKLLTGGNDE